MYLGSSAQSPSARRRFLIAALMLWSNSTMVSFGHSFFRCPRRADQLGRRPRPACAGAGATAPAAVSSGRGAEFSAPQVEFKDTDANADWLRLLHGLGISGAVAQV